MRREALPKEVLLEATPEQVWESFLRQRFRGQLLLNEQGPC